MSNAFTFPSASYLTQYLGWFWGDHIPPLPEAEKFIAPPEDLNEVTPYAALGYVYHAGNFQEQEHDSGSGMLNSLEYYQKACQKLQEAVLKVRKGESPPVCLVFMGNDYVWDPQRQLKAVKCYYELMCYATECTGSYHVLHSLYHTLKADGNENEYGYRGKHYLKQYADSLEQLDRFCELMYAEKMIVNHKYGTYRNNGEKLACVLAVRNFLAKL